MEIKVKETENSQGSDSIEEARGEQVGNWCERIVRVGGTTCLIAIPIVAYFALSGGLLASCPYWPDRSTNEYCHLLDREITAFNSSKITNSTEILKYEDLKYDYDERCLDTKNLYRRYCWVLGEVSVIAPIVLFCGALGPLVCCMSFEPKCRKDFYKNYTSHAMGRVAKSFGESAVAGYYGLKRGIGSLCNRISDCCSLAGWEHVGIEPDHTEVKIDLGDEKV